MTKTMTKALNIKFTWISTIILSLFLLVYYILQTGALTQEIYLINDYERKLSTLSENNKFLDINLSKMNSLANIKNYLLNKDFLKPNRANQVKYIQILESSVVSRGH